MQVEMIYNPAKLLQCILLLNVVIVSYGFVTPTTPERTATSTKSMATHLKMAKKEGFFRSKVRPVVNRMLFKKSTPAKEELFHDFLLSRRTINEFESDLPSHWEDALYQAIEAATFAPNHKRTEPWRFHLLGPEKIRNVCELNAKLVTASKGEKAGEKKLNRWLAMPGWLVVTCVGNDDDTLDDPSGIAREDYAACCCAVQNLCLSLHANGMGTKWTTGPVNFDPEFGKAAGIPSNEYVVGTMWFGTPSSLPKSPKKKRSVEDVLTKHA